MCGRSTARRSSTPWGATAEAARRPRTWSSSGWASRPSSDDDAPFPPTCGARPSQRRRRTSGSSYARPAVGRASSRFGPDHGHRDSTTIGEHLGPERTKFLFDEVSDLVEAEVLRGATVARADRNTRDDLVDQPGDPDHEEFVEVTREDSAELDALEKRFVRVRRQLRARGHSDPATRAFDSGAPRLARSDAVASTP